MHWVGIEIGIVVMASIKPQRSADVFEIPMAASSMVTMRVHVSY